MPWCPKCKNEYVAGKTHCPDCHVDLVEELAPETLAESADMIEIPKDYEFPEDFNPEEILNGPKERPKPSRVFKSAQERYADTRSSAYTFLLVGSIGFVVIVLALAGVYQLPFHDFALVSMLLLFCVFIGIGMVSLKNSKKIQASIETENAFVEQVKHWYETEGSLQEPIQSIPLELPEEIRYFQRYDAIRQTLSQQFPEMEEALLDKLTSDFCEEG